MGMMCNISGNTIRISDGTSLQVALEDMDGDIRDLKSLQDEVEQLKQEMVDNILLGQTPQTKSVYEMTYDEYMELSGYARL